MQPFLTEDFLLQTRTARALYHDFAENMPIFDYHCHLLELVHDLAGGPDLVVHGGGGAQHKLEGLFLRHDVNLRGELRRA